MIITIHQPEHMPWLGFMHKAYCADVLVLLDDVQFRKNYFQNRNKVRSASEYSWITIPIKKHPLRSPINEIQINNTVHWQKKYWKTVDLNYRKTLYFQKYRSFFEDIYTQRSWDSLSAINIESIQRLFTCFAITTKVILASELENISGNRDERLLAICKKIGAKTYLSGISGRDYLDVEKFEQAGIKVVFQEFFHPIYKQCFQPFTPCMSSIDLLFNCGEKAQKVLISSDTPRLDYAIK